MIKLTLCLSALATLAALGCATSTEEPDAREAPAVVVETDGKVETARARTDNGTCECTRAAGSIVWRCNGKCSDAELANLP